MRKRHKTPLQSFEDHYIPEPNSGCWLWFGADNDAGHGQMTINNRRVYAHVFSYEHYVGRIPDGLEIDHLCRVRCCVNPDHLEPVTRLENILRSPIMRPAACPNGHEYTTETAYVTKTGRRVCKQCDHERYLKRYTPKRGRHVRISS